MVRQRGIHRSYWYFLRSSAKALTVSGSFRSSPWTGTMISLLDRLAVDRRKRGLDRLEPHLIGLLRGDGLEDVVLGEKEIGQLLGSVGAEDEDLALLAGVPHRLHRTDRAAFIRGVEDLDVGIGGDDVAGHRDRLLGEPRILIGDDLDPVALDRAQEAVDAGAALLGEQALELEDADLGLAAELLRDELRRGRAGCLGRSAPGSNSGRPKATSPAIVEL